MDLKLFGKHSEYYNALKNLFEILNIPVNYIDEEPLSPKTILSNTFKENSEAFFLMEDVYALGIIDDSAFSVGKSKALGVIKESKKDYDGILIFGVTLHKLEKNLFPTRTQLSEITRAFNREFHLTPVVIIFRYEGYISITNVERVDYKQERRGGEKAGKVSLIRDIDIKNPHTGHLKKLHELSIERFGRNAITNFKEFYNYWQEVFSVSLLNKQFYKELSDWYFWAMREVSFPGAPKNSTELKEHNATNLLRLLTRLLFVWFVKEKKLIPEVFFNVDYVKNELLNDLHIHKGKTNQKSHDSTYYRAILQNLFFATLSQEMGKRTFHRPGQQMSVTKLLRYENYFKNSHEFINLVEKVVPFMNSGLFECLDKPIERKRSLRDCDIIEYIDGFSEQTDDTLSVPDYVFFGTEEHVDLSEDYGQGTRNSNDVSVSGIIDILNSYKFTVYENTPVEQDIALDPELLGRVFENLLASYNPETKSTARKQTGSFYTPREIVNYMVEESLIAYLKTRLGSYLEKEKSLEEKLRQLLSYEDIQPFGEENTKKEIIRAIDECKILDPACGSGAFPMGVLHKMIHIIHKIDPFNKYWKECQINKIRSIDDRSIRDSRIADIEDAFENNEPDYSRKLYLIENCIYGVDIQPIAVQISKLRFFISLIVDQKINKNKRNHGVRPLPNLETKFVAANALIGIDKPEVGNFAGNLFDDSNIKEMKLQLKDTRQRLFSAEIPSLKRELRKEDKNLREKIAYFLRGSGLSNKTTRQLADWDPYKQNASSTFFDAEWMFDISTGFNIVIANPPYISNRDMHKLKMQDLIKVYNKNYISSKAGNYDICILFIENGLRHLSKSGHLTFIVPNKFLIAKYSNKIMKHINETSKFCNICDFSMAGVFKEASVYPIVINIEKVANNSNITSRHFMNYEGYPVVLTTIKWDYINHSPIGKAKVKNEKIFSKIEKADVIRDEISFSPGINGFQFTNYGKCITEGMQRKKSKKVVTTGAIDPFEICDKPIKYNGKYYNQPYIYYDSTLISPGKWKLFSTPKIIIAGMTKKIEATLDEFGDFAPAVSVYSIIANVQLLKHILPIISSRLINWYFKCKFQDKHLAGGYISMNTKLLEKIPIVKTSNNLDLTKGCEKLLKANLNGSINTDNLMAELDASVASLYGLSKVEYKFILNELGEKEDFILRTLDEFDSINKSNDYLK